MKTTITLPDDLHLKLKLKAVNERTSINDLFLKGVESLFKETLVKTQAFVVNPLQDLKAEAVVAPIRPDLQALIERKNSGHTLSEMDKAKLRIKTGFSSASTILPKVTQIKRCSHGMEIGKCGKGC